MWMFMLAERIIDPWYGPYLHLLFGPPVPGPW